MAPREEGLTFTTVEAAQGLGLARGMGRWRQRPHSTWRCAGLGRTSNE